MTRKILKVSAIVLMLLFAVAQFVRPARTNPAVAAGQSLEEASAPPAEVARVLERSCMDCHSNRTRWPWYSNVAPVSWWLTDHVNHGRRHLNFSEWGSYDAEEADALLGDICKTAKSGTMPLGSYTFVHRGARLSHADVRALCDWTTAERRRLALRSPAAVR